MMKDELGLKIMGVFVALRAKMHPCRKLDCLAAQHEHKKIKNKLCKGTKECLVAEIF